MTIAVTLSPWNNLIKKKCNKCFDILLCEMYQKINNWANWRHLSQFFVWILKIETSNIGQTQKHTKKDIISPRDELSRKYSNKKQQQNGRGHIWAKALDDFGLSWYTSVVIKRNKNFQQTKKNTFRVVCCIFYWFKTFYGHRCYCLPFITYFLRITI